MFLTATLGVAAAAGGLAAGAVGALNSGTKLSSSSSSALLFPLSFPVCLDSVGVVSAVSDDDL